ncbi:hypothetical protein DVS28_b0539 (plasmid) [Euzebya pacifica]|uniref:Uncharacterized protein n=1 Tax=Euzebya pacifica TaxID=1608957 RepID=A0A346Y732_9ACTN|nr:hypothetical protein [Euzebya pacifica]AXV10279.1 hypothetical protein DVS28_b0539 [Euzebya pacifica]
MPAAVAKVCAHPLGAGKSCTKKTKHPTGKCNHHKGLSAPVSTSGAIVSTAAVSNPMGANPTQGAGVGGTDAVAWLPAEGPPTGAPLGVSVMVADGDVEDSSVIAMRYASSKAKSGHRDMLYLKLTPEGEQKMVDALGLSGTKTVVQTKQVTEMGTHPADTDGIQGQITTLAKSVNARMKAGTDRFRSDESPTNTQRLQTIRDTLEGMKSKGAGPQFDAMIAHYQQSIDEIAVYLDDPSYEPAAYGQPGGKIGMLHPWEGEVTKTIEEHVQVPIDSDLSAALLPTVEVEGKRPSIQNSNGTASWNGSMTSADCPPKMWQIDLGDGYKVLYYPDAVTSGSGKAFSQKRRMTVIAPTNGDAAGALERLDRLHLSGTPMTAAGAEYTYLERNAYGMGILEHPDVQAARVEAADYGVATAKAQVWARREETVGMGPDELRAWLRSVRTKAEADVLPARAKRLREGVAKALGFPSGAAMAADPTYDPTPKRSQGGIWFDRFRQGPNGPDPRKATTSYHVSITGGSATDIVRNGGALASTVRRRQMGINAGKGMSEGADINSGGASAVFLHFKPQSYGKPSGSSYGKPEVVWNGAQAQALSRRTDWYFTTGDHFGATNPDDHHFHDGFHRDFGKLGSYSGEMMMEGTVGLISHPPTWIKTGGHESRESVIAEFAKLGVTEFHDGRKVADVVI